MGDSIAPGIRRRRGGSARRAGPRRHKCWLLTGSAGRLRWSNLPSASHRLALVRLAQEAVRARPDLPDLRLVFANAVEATGGEREALATLEDACRSFPDHEPLHAGYGAALSKAGKNREALDCARRWAGRIWAQKLEFRMLTRLGRRDELAEREASLEGADPTDPDLFDYRAVKWRNDPGSRLRSCEAALARDPSAMHLVYHRAMALSQLGRAREASDAMGLDRFLHVEPLGKVDGFDDAEAFRQTLASEIVRNATLHQDPTGHATQAGLRTKAFPVPGDRAGPALIGALRRSVSAYAGALAGDHPFVQARPERARFTCWALVFGDAGHQRLHHHAGAWMTGVYYVAAPDAGRKLGALRIGGTPDWVGPPPWSVVDVAPVPGRLVLFPSFVPHETLPTGSNDGERISVAFDVTAV